MKYTIILEREEEGCSARCLELPGAISQRETREEALENIKEAIELVLEVIHNDVEMPKQIHGAPIDKRTRLLDRPLKANEEEIVIKFKKEPIVKNKVDVPENIVQDIANKDLEELV